MAVRGAPPSRKEVPMGTIWIALVLSLNSSVPSQPHGQGTSVSYKAGAHCDPSFRTQRVGDNIVHCEWNPCKRTSHIEIIPVTSLGPHGFEGNRGCE